MAAGDGIDDYGSSVGGGWNDARLDDWHAEFLELQKTFDLHKEASRLEHLEQTRRLRNLRRLMLRGEQKRDAARARARAELRRDLLAYSAPVTVALLGLVGVLFAQGH